MRRHAILVLASALALAGCYTPSAAEEQAEADRLADLVAKTASVVEADLDAVGAACGTKLTVVAEGPSAGAVIIDSSATDAQAACVQNVMPNARRTVR
jgi:hypothetical protein